MALPTPADVKALPYSAALLAAFAAVPDEKVQELIDNGAAWFGSPEVKQHTQRDEAVLYLAGHLLYLRLVGEGVIKPPAGGGGLPGAASSRRLDGVGSTGYAVVAPKVEDYGDWSKQWSPFLVKLMGIVNTFPPGISVASGVPGNGFAGDYC